ncbi:MAG: PAS domain S-box protein [Pseudomonadota bacterium]
MSETTIENQLRLANSELSKRIAILEEKLRAQDRSEVALRESEKRYRRLFESAHDGILILDADSGQVVDANPYLLRLLGYAYDELCGKFIWGIGAFKDIAASKDAFKILQDKEYIRYEDLPLQTRDGHSIAVEFVSNVYLVDHSKVIQCNIRDITERKQTQAESNRFLEAIKQAGEAIIITDIQGTIEFINPAFEQITGYTWDEAVGQNARILKSGKQDELFYRKLWETISGGNTWSGRMVNKHKDGTPYTEDATISPVRDSSGRIVNYVAVKRDITDHLRLASQFEQAQKMEAVGILAGGVAHDSNNMLSVIIGYTEMALDTVDPSQPLHGHLVEILKAARRSTDITRQLLTFARKQVILPRVLDLNKNVESMLSMLRRLIGEDINLTWLPAIGLWPVLIDPIQVDQILANLCVNARDAITNVGRVSIETENRTFEEAYLSDDAEVVSGEYVLLAVSDDGHGMEKETLDHVFEPFFTSKGVGQGTGLGLSMVYGIVKQNHGFINVYSEPGVGTTFKIYLPRHAGQAVDASGERALEIPLGRSETVLLVEDEPALLALCKAMLEKLGYQVLTAGTPDEAIGLAKEHADEIRILITDVVMPGMNGRELAERLKPDYPSIKILFMSGYTAEMIAHRGVLEAGMNFLHKPFSLKDLAVKVWKTLNREGGEVE